MLLPAWDSGAHSLACRKTPTPWLRRSIVLGRRRVLRSTTTSFGYTYNTSSLAQPSVGIWLFGLACAVGAVFSFKTPYAKSVPKESR